MSGEDRSEDKGRLGGGSEDRVVDYPEIICLSILDKEILLGGGFQPRMRLACNYCYMKLSLLLVS